jgi:hypothetical protein
MVTDDCWTTQLSFAAQCTIAAALIAIATFTLTGCAAVDGYPRRPETHSTVEARREMYYGAKADDTYNATAADQRKAVRDILVYGKMQVLEDDFLAFERSLNSAGNYVSVGSDLGVLVLNGLAATTGTAATKSALAAASAGVVGAQGAVNKDLYYQKTLAALLAQIQANREKARLTIIQKLGSSDADYPLNAAEIDLKKLEEAGSLVNAVNDISQQATTQKAVTEDQIKNVQKLSASVTKTSERIRAWLYIDGKVDQVHYDALQAWLNIQPEPFLNGQGFPPAALLGDTPASDLEPIRARACADTKLAIPGG